MDDPSLIIAGLALIGTIFAAITTYRSSKAATRVGLEANAFQRAVAAEEKAQAAENKAEQANLRADACNRRMRQMELDLVSLESRFRYFVHMVHDPYMTLELLRERVPQTFNASRREENND